jgi:hypothetical protein
MAEGRIQMLTHRTENTVWQERWLAHPIGAVGLGDVVIAVADVAEAAERFARFADRKIVPMQFGRAVMLDRGAVQLVVAQVFAELFPEVNIPGLPFMGAYGLIVQSLDAAEQALRQGGISTRQMGRALAAKFPEELGVGAWLFVERAADLPWRA